MFLLIFMYIVFFCSICFFCVKYLIFLNFYYILFLGKYGGKNLNMIFFDCIDIFNYFFNFKIFVVRILNILCFEELYFVLIL